MLTDTSKKFIHITNTIVKPVYKTPPTKFTQNAVKMYKMLFNRIAYANELWEVNKRTITYTDKSIVNIDTTLYPGEIKNIIETQIHEYSKLTFNVGERSIIMYVSHEYNTNIDDIIKHTYMWLTIASFYAKGKCSQSLNIYLSMSIAKKQLPIEHAGYIDREHVNTAYTFACEENNVIHIYRKEEWFKVLIHETFHSFGLDFSAVDYTSTNKQILDIFNVIADVRIFESYCEMWAELINNMFIVFFSTKWNKNIDNWANTCVRKFEVLIYNDQIFSMLQCAKILSHFQMKYSELISRRTPSAGPSKKYRDNTHVLAYYIIKSLLLYNVNDFMEACINMNGFSLNFDKYKNRIEENMRKYCEMVKIMHDNPNYIAELSNMMSLLTKRVYKRLPKDYQQSLYMSQHELG